MLLIRFSFKSLSRLRELGDGMESQTDKQKRDGDQG